jgi:ATP-dependent DNA ligase
MARGWHSGAMDHYGTPAYSDLTPDRMPQALASYLSGWIATEKVDGVRCTVTVRDGLATGTSRTGKHLFASNVRLVDCIAHGELKDGTLYLFDVSEYAGDDLRQRPYGERLALTRRITQWSHVQAGDAATLLAMVLADDGEGIVLADPNGLWGDDLVRVKPVYTVDYVCTGYTIGKSGKVVSMACGLYRDGELVEAGSVVAIPPEMQAAPDLQIGRVFEASGSKRWDSGALAGGAFVRWRDDKPATACV